MSLQPSSRDVRDQHDFGRSHPTLEYRPTTGPETAARETGRDLAAFVYRLAHDLHAPLRAIRGFTQMAADEHAAALDGEGRRLLDLVLVSAARMGAQLQGLTRFAASLEAIPQPAPIDMSAMAQDVVEERRRSESDRVVEWTTRRLPPAHGDPQLIRQVWVALIGNASKFTRRTPMARIAIDASEDDAGTVYSVADNGVGFDMRYAKGLFEVFQRLHAEDDFPGTGVDLAIARQIVALHGGRIWAVSRPGQGATSASVSRVDPAVTRRVRNWTGDAVRRRAEWRRAAIGPAEWRAA